MARETQLKNPEDVVIGDTLALYSARIVVIYKGMGGRSFEYLYRFPEDRKGYYRSHFVATAPGLQIEVIPA